MTRSLRSPNLRTVPAVLRVAIVAGCLAIATGSVGRCESPVNRLESVQVEHVGDSAEPWPAQQPEPDADPIEQELRMHRAIARAIEGDREQAVRILESLDVTDTAALYAGAIWLMDSGRMDDGVRVLQRILPRSDAPPEAQKLLAVGYLHLDQPEQSQREAEAYLLDDPDDAYVQYIRGLALLRQNDLQRAQGALRQAGYDEGEVEKIRQVMLQAPVDVSQRLDAVDSSQAVVRQLGTRDLPQERFYNFTLLLAGEYDSNVPLQPRFSGLGSQIDYEDYRAVMATFLDVQLLTCDLYNLGLVGSTFNTFQFDSDDFNIQDYMGGAYSNGMLLDDLVGAVRYEFHHTLVDESRFASAHRLTPSLTWLGSRGHTTLYYEYNPIDTDAPALIPAQLQSAEIHRLGLTQAVYTFEGDGRLYAGYQYANALADGADFDRHTNMVTGRIERPLPRNWIADLDVRYVWDDYDNPNSLDFFGRARDDNRIAVRAGLQKNFVSPISLRLDYTYINNDSNTENLFGVRFYDYDRHVFSTQLIFSL